MQSRHMDSILSEQWSNMLKNVPEISTEELREHYQTKAQEIQEQTTNLPEGMRTPTAEEVMQMSDYAKEYRKKKPGAKEREVKRAVKRKFNVQILPDTL